MQRRTISLDGAWERRDFLDEEWRWSDAVHATDAASEDGPPVKASSNPRWRAGSVPGSTVDDAWRAAEIPNPYVDRNSLDAEWIAQRTWVYRRRFSVPEPAAEGATFRFESIDPGGTVILDGEEIARHEGMFVPLAVQLPSGLRPGQHELVVAIDPAPWMPSQVSRTEQATRHRSRMAYGWDFCPRLVGTGLRGSVELDLYRSRIGDVRIHVDLAGDLRSATVQVTSAVEGEIDGLRRIARVIGPGGDVRATADDLAHGTAAITMRVESPELWWPNGSGAAAMHRLHLVLEGEDGRRDEREVPFGIRSVALAPTEGAPSQALPYTLIVNGRPTWIRGWNWVPIDALHGVPRPDRLRHLIELARRANVNLLRVWGGGLIESDAFYDACDAAGIMVWQEFIQSSSGVANTPSSDPEFVDLMRREAEAIVPTRSHHPSLVLWCGGNELADEGGRPLTDDHPVLAALHDVVRRLDPGRGWLPTSPTGPRFDNSLAAIAEDATSLHDVHGPWEHQGLRAQHALANATTSLLHGEFGVEGMTNLASLRATVTDPERWTADRSDPVMAHRGAWWNNVPFVHRAFGGDLRLDELQRASQHLQADGLRTLIDGDRRRWPRNAGALPWAFNEPFPNAWSNAAVDYFGEPRAAYFAVAEAYAPVAIGLGFASQALDGADRFAVTPWVVNDTETGLRDELVLCLYDGTGRRVADARQAVDVGPNSVATAREVTLRIPPATADLLILDAAFGGRGARRLLSRTATLAPLRALPPADLGASVDAHGDGWTVLLRVTGSVPAIEVRIGDGRPAGWPERAGAVYVTPNVVTLLPGEERAIRVEWHSVVIGDRCLRLSAWNVAERRLTNG